MDLCPTVVINNIKGTDEIHTTLTPAPELASQRGCPPAVFL